MTALAQAVEDYLRLRRSLGFKLKREGEDLKSFVSYMQAVGADTVTVADAVGWATMPASAKPVYWAKRLGSVRGFARYLEALDPATEIPASDLLPYRGWMRPTPYLYSQAEIAALMSAAGRLQTRLGSATMRTLIGLLAVTGMRIGEALRLDRKDVDLEDGRLIVRNSKFGKSRQLPLHPTTIAALRDYLTLRDHLKPTPETPALLIGARGDRLSYGCAEWTFRLLRKRIGLTGRPGSRAPRLHEYADVRVMPTLGSSALQIGLIAA